MTSSSYMLGRKKYQRPQAMLWADNPGTLSNGFYIPTGFEVGAAVVPTIENQDLLDQFIILSDDNRDPISFSPTRIETRQRTINGRMRSYHVADKLELSTSWDMLPSRAYKESPEFSLQNGKSPSFNNRSFEYTTDGGAGGVEILDWYETHQGPFWVYLAYDKYSNFKNTEDQYSHLQKYNQVLEMYISNFSYSVQKRGGSNHDFWNISVSLEEV
jgi:hypothetical protein